MTSPASALAIVSGLLLAGSAAAQVASVDSRNSPASLRCSALGQIDEADAPLREAARLNPQSAETRFYLGSVYAAQNRFDLAAQSFKEALKIEVNFAAAHESLARVLSAQGKREEAMAHYQEAIRLISARRGGPRAP
mgnify:CR=1 FL=1